MAALQRSYAAPFEDSRSAGAEGKRYATSIAEILSSRATALDPEVRLAFCKALVTLRNRKIIDALAVLDLFFTLIPCEDKVLRKFICGSINALLKKLALQQRDRKLLSEVQALLFTKLKESRRVVVRVAELALIDGFRKGFLRDAKTANALAECCFHRASRILITAMRFFLGTMEDERSDLESDGSEREDEDQKTLKEVVMAYRAVKKTRKKKKCFEKAKKMLHKEKKSRRENAGKCCNLLAIQFIYDPQTFVERLFGQLDGRRSEKFETRLLHMALCARMIGVTRILLYAAQACHELIPPDIIHQLVYVIAQNFVSDRNSAEAMTVGLNTIREIFYKRYKNKNVSMAARAIITLFRAVNPKLLHRKDRGRPSEAVKNVKVYEFGMEKARDFVEGAECLPEEVDTDPEHELSHRAGIFTSEAAAIHFKGIMLQDDEKRRNVESCEKAKKICETRILTQEDFRKINAFRLKKCMTNAGKRKNDDIKLDEELEEKIARYVGPFRQNEESGLPRLKDIENFHKKLHKETKEQRMEAIRRGREGRQDYGKPKKRGVHVGHTNREMAKWKNFQMVRPKPRGKNRMRSFKDRQKSLGKYLLRQAGGKV
ncbi:unnamed protein product [Gongylonema pulchrum]|uniref:Protein SDA1 n=1 Tax=Gongylonema pulchrum TaxID=637853 RepID=A0A183DP19_9BILA|nr:unnamed protein product [Gongylonema pulchrum]